MIRTMRGMRVQKSVHYLWTEYIRLHDSTGLRPTSDHAGHPLCRVPKGRRYECASDPAAVTCRACLKRMALAVDGEESWRLRIIECYKSSWPVRRDAVYSEMDAKRRRALKGCAAGDHSMWHGMCMDCKVVAWPV